MQLPQILAAAFAAVLATQVSADHPVPVENPKEVLKSTYTGKEGMNDLAKLSGKYMGTASDIFNVSEMATDIPYVTELNNKKDWGSITSCNLMKWENIHPEPNRYAFENADKLVKVAKGIGAHVRCHAFAWYGQNPSWVNNANWTKAEAEKQLEKHITTVMTHFGNDCYAWDVVNEAFEDSGALRAGVPWYRYIGPSYVQKTFDIANKVKKQYNLKSKLYYNDYSLDSPSNKTVAVVKFIKEQLLGHGIDGVGFQGHFFAGQTPSKEVQIKQLNEYTKLGLDVAYTEVDVRTKMPPSLEVQKQQAKDYATVIAACKAVDRCVGITLWDFDDEYSWIPVSFKGEGYGSPWFQPDGVNSTLVRKAAYDAVIEGWKGCSNSTQQQQQQQKPKCQYL